MNQLIDGPQSQLDKTVKIFDSFYNYSAAINANHYEIVFSYFLSVCQSRNTAKNFTTMIFRIASTIGENPMTLLEYLQGTGDKMQATRLMIYYLNSLKSKTTLYGVNAYPTPNESIQRNIVT
jgi:hypothetical protein